MPRSEHGDRAISSASRGHLTSSVSCGQPTSALANDDRQPIRPTNPVEYAYTRVQEIGGDIDPTNGKP